MATLNLDYYDGNDYYSDGEIENVILNIIKSKKHFGSYSEMDNFFPVLYHLSPERENILNWYPFKKTDIVLEIGAGCGAITGLLCRLTKHVTAVELSKTRSEINYERNKEYDNLDIIVGNSDLIDFKIKFDYVVLNGVFEYAMSFTNHDNPYVFFLNNIKQYLKSDGKILLSIENRLGVKYFSGATEDHTNTYYAGLNGYKQNNTVRTFSKKELEDIFIQCDFKSWKFYYPYPDYKFPIEIFTDENVNGRNYGRIYRNYQSGRISILNEYEMINTFKKEQIMGQFANSFMVEICVHDRNISNIIYAKLNNTRRKEFCISTVIYENQGKHFVQKRMLDKSAHKHIENIYNNQQKFLPEKFEYLKGEYIGGAIRYPYIQNENLDMQMTKLLEAGKVKEVEQEIDYIFNAFISKAQMKDDFYSYEFMKHFGCEKINNKDECIECIEGCNIDLIFDNLYKIKGNYIVIDPEWVFDFWIPVKFVIWRMLNEWYSKYVYIDEVLPRKKLYNRYRINSKMCSVFEKWAIYFATSYVANIDIDAFAQREKVLDINKIIGQYCDKEIIYSSLYIDYGNGYNESEKRIIKMNMEGNRFHIKVNLDNTRFIYSIRWDPIENRCCRCAVRECEVDLSKVDVVPINSDIDDRSLFLLLDPQFQIQIKPGNYETIELSGELEILDDTMIYSLMKEKNKEFETWTKERVVLNNTITELEGVKKDLGTHIQELEKQCENLNSENIKLIEDKVALLAENKRIETGYKIILSENTVLHNETQIIKSNNKKIFEERQMLSNEKQGLLKESEEMKKKSAQLLNELKDAQKNRELQDIQILELNNRIKSIENDKIWKVLNKLRMWKGK